MKYHEDLEAQIEDMRATGKNRIVQMLTPEQRPGSKNFRSSFRPGNKTHPTRFSAIGPISCGAIPEFPIASLPAW